MSSYVVGDRTALAVAQGLVDSHYFTNSSATVARLVRELINLNVRMTCWRYEEEPSDQLVSGPQAEAIARTHLHGAHYRRFTDAEVVGCARCWMYQCDVDDRIENSYLYRLVGQMVEDTVGRNEASGEWREVDRAGNGDAQVYARTEYEEGGKTVTQWDSPVEFPWGLD